jgi:pimeloyl-ACP methyl ester carboxylesterase
LKLQKTFGIVSVLLILSVSVVASGISVADRISAFAQTNETRQDNSNNTNATNINQINQTLTKKIRVGDIDVGYKMFGKGDPLFLVMGFKGTMDLWDQRFLQNLASQFRVVIFDNRGMGKTTLGDTYKNSSIVQFANDTAGLMDALGFKKASVLGWSMGGFIAQELVLNHPDKVDRLILYATSCGGKEAVFPGPDVLKNITDTTGSLKDQHDRFAYMLFPEEWIKQVPNYADYFPMTNESTPASNVERQWNAIMNWGGACNRIQSITQPTLVIGGKNDSLTLPPNFVLLTERIPGSWLIQINGAGHGLMYQYPDALSQSVLLFLSLMGEG